MYVGRSEKLRNPPPARGTRPVIAEAPPSFVEDCDVNFSARPTKQRQTARANTLVTTANTTLQGPPSAPVTTSREVSLVVRAIDLYRDALLVDPYNADATLNLALAYDAVLRKGCALAMLRRLDELATHPVLEVEAKPQLALVKQNVHWFRHYRPEALKAAGL